LLHGCEVQVQYMYVPGSASQLVDDFRRGFLFLPTKQEQGTKRG
jgi:hypothetical protein